MKCLLPFIKSCYFNENENSRYQCYKDIREQFDFCILIYETPHSMTKIYLSKH